MKTLFILISLFFAVSLSARQRDSRVREYLPPARIIWQQESQLIQGAKPFASFRKWTSQSCES